MKEYKVLDDKFKENLVVKGTDLKDELESYRDVCMAAGVGRIEIAGEEYYYKSLENLLNYFALSFSNPTFIVEFLSKFKEDDFKRIRSYAEALVSEKIKNLHLSVAIYDLVINEYNENYTDKVHFETFNKNFYNSLDDLGKKNYLKAYEEIEHAVNKDLFKDGKIYLNDKDENFYKIVSDGASEANIRGSKYLYDEILSNALLSLDKALPYFSFVDSKASDPQLYEYECYYLNNKGLIQFFINKVRTRKDYHDLVSIYRYKGLNYLKDNQEVLVKSMEENSFVIRLFLNLLKALNFMESGGYPEVLDEITKEVHVASLQKPGQVATLSFILRKLEA